jgi:hypothetical protein
MGAQVQTSSRLNKSVLVATGASQREGFEWRQLAVWSYHIVIGDLDRCGATAM